MIWILLKIHLQININKVNTASAVLVTRTTLRNDDSRRQSLYVNQTTSSRENIFPWSCVKVQQQQQP